MDERHERLIEECIERTLELEEETELVEFTVAGSVGNAALKVFVYRPQGVTVEDCARVSRRLSRELESREELQQSYSIEVSSPGLDRKLTEKRDFERALGEVLKVRVRNEDGVESDVLGLLTGVEEEDLLFDPPRERMKGAEKGAAKGDPFRISLNRIIVGRIEVQL